MERRGDIHDAWFVGRLQASGSAALVTATAMAVPVGILLTGFSMSGLFITENLKPTAAFVCTIIFTLLFPLLMVTFDAMRKMEGIVSQIRDTTKFDSLTRVLSRSYFLDLMRGASEDGYVLIVDADYFKRINDTFGHGAGDSALAELAMNIEWGVGNWGRVGRLGSEEFGVFLPGISRSLAQKLAEDIRTRVECHPIFAAGTEVSLTVSIGAAPYFCGQPLRTALTLADINLIRAKESGRNTVVFNTTLPELDCPQEILQIVR